MASRHNGLKRRLQHGCSLGAKSFLKETVGPSGVNVQQQRSASMLQNSSGFDTAVAPSCGILGVCTFVGSFGLLSSGTLVLRQAKKKNPRIPWDGEP